MTKLAVHTVALAALAASLAAPSIVSGAQAAPNVKKFTLVSVLVGESKFWLPSTIVVHQGDTVELTLRNEIPGKAAEHGFSLPGYGITEIVTRGRLKTVKFVADKPGVYDYYCQLHPAHIGGQLIVEPKGVAGGTGPLQSGAGSVSEERKK